MINTVCFDLDGTLVDSKYVIFNTFDYVFKNLYPEYREKNLYEYRKYMGPLLEETFGLFTKDSNKIKESVQYYIDYYKSIEYKYLKPFNNINSTLEWLKENNINVCLLTNKRMSSSVPSLEYFDLYKYFDDFITSDRQKDKPKPDKYPITIACKDLNVDSNNVLMVGDNEVDILCGINAGSKTALVSYNEWSKDVLKKVKPSYIIDDMKELIDIIKKENNI